MIIERMIQHIIPGKWAELEDLDQKNNVIEARLGFPPKRRMRCISGGHDTNTLIIEREWESLAAMEAVINKAFADPEYQTLMAHSDTIIASLQWETYRSL